MGLWNTLKYLPGDIKLKKLAKYYNKLYRRKGC